MPLGQLADEMVRQCCDLSRTAVLVTPSQLSLRPAFFVELVAAICRQCPHRVRVDWCHDPQFPLWSVICSAAKRRRVKSINRQLACRDVPGSVELTASIGRPDPAANLLVIGVCEQRVELPKWSAAVRLSTSRHEHTIRRGGACRDDQPTLLSV